MSRKDGLDVWQVHHKLSAYLRDLETTRILARTSPAIAEAWGQRIHGRSLAACGTRCVSGFSPETRARIEQLRAMGALR